jgi:hypothetical protein
LTYTQERLSWRSLFEEYRILEQFQTNHETKRRFTKQNQLKKESKEMNSKVRAPRLQETKVFVTPKSKSNQDGTQDNMESFKRDERRNMEKESETRNSKLDVKSLWLQQHMKVTKKTPQEALILNHGNETLEEDGPREEDEEREETQKKEEEEDRPREEDAPQWIHAVWNPEEKQMVQHLEWMNCTPKLGVNKRTQKPQTPSN